MTHIYGEASSRVRHERESAARAAQFVGGISRESIRRIRVVKSRAPHLVDALAAGTLSLNAAYDEVMGETRAALYLKVPLYLDEALRAAAAEFGCTRQQLVLAILTGALVEERS